MIFEAGKDFLRSRLKAVNRRFLIYVEWNCKALYPYPKGINLTIHGWIPGGNEQGWKLHTSHLPDGCTNRKWDMPSQGESGPLYVEVVRWIDRNLENL